MGLRDRFKRNIHVPKPVNKQASAPVQRVETKPYDQLEDANNPLNTINPKSSHYQGNSSKTEPDSYGGSE